MDLSELSQRLKALEDARSADTQKAAEQAFMDKYGSSISNNKDLGLVILQELNRRGVDTSAADAAVQEILDGLRMEATALLDTIKGNMNQASELIDKINSVDESVQSAAVATGTVPEGEPTPEGEPPLEPPLEPPAEPAPEGEPPLEPPAEPAPEGEPPLEPPAEPAPEETVTETATEKMPAGNMLSDERLKNIKSHKLGCRPNKNAFIKPKAHKKEEMYSFPKSFVDIASGGR